MCRLSRRLFTLCSAVSLLLCVTVCVLWVRSYGRLEGVSIPLSSEPYPTLHYDRWLNTRCYVVSSCGRLTLHWQRFIAGPNVAVMWRTRAPGGGTDDAERLADRRRVFAGFGWWRGALLGGYWRLTVPWWFAATCASVVPLAGVRRWRRTRTRIRLGLCPACGYDLRASPGRCPECGTPATAAAATAAGDSA